MLWALLALPFYSFAGIPEGTAWLSIQQNADHSFGNTATSLATPVQSTAEVLRTYAALGQQGLPAFVNALGYLNGDSEANTEFLVRKIVVNAAAGNDVAALITALTRNQNADGGFGNQAGQSSAILDTAFALHGLAAAGYASSPQVAAAVGFLVNRQAAAGGWVDGNNEPSVHLTALALRGLWSYRNSYVGVSATLGKAQNFLLSKQGIDGAWGENFDTALALMALIPQVSDLSAIQGAVAKLQGGQLGNGSWNDDAYTTALALQALRLYELRQGTGLVQNGSISGYVIKSGSTEPIAGATVTLKELPGISVLSNTDGYFIFSGLPAGTYTISASKSGYTAASIVASAQPNQVTLGGNVVLGVADQTGLVRGKIFDAADLLPSSGAAVTLSGSGIYSATTNGNGEFDLGALPVGSYAITVAKSGYYTVNGSATVTAGQTLTINQGLTLEGAFQDTNPAPVSGTVISAKTGLPVAGAMFDLGGGLMATTSADGAFSIAAVPRGNYTATLSAGGYVTQAYSIGFPAGASGKLGALSLYPAASDTAPTALTLNGLVVNGVTRAPIAGASVTLVETGTTVTTGTDGRFTLDGITLMSFKLGLSATGFESSTVSLQVAAFGIAETTLALSLPGSGATTSTLQGTVRDATTGSAIGGATVRIVGTTLSAVAGADGSYSLSGIDQLQFMVSVSAVGYTEQSQPIQIASHGSYVLDPLLAPISGDSFTIVSVQAEQTQSGANSIALFTANIASLLPVEKSALVLGEILDATGQSVAQVVPYAEGTTVPMAEFAFNANEVKTITVPWNTLQFVPGTYKLVLRVVEPGTINASVPWGQIHAEGGAYTGIVETPAVGGALMLDPPLTQAGASTPVTFNALVRNDGNVALAGGSYVLSVTKPDTGAVLYSAEASADGIEPAQNAPVSFGPWVPTEAGNLAVKILPQTAGIAGEIAGTLYVGDKANGSFTLNKTVVPEGTQTVHGRIDMHGVDTRTGSSTDPLFALVKNAVTKGGAYTAPGAVNWHTTNRCLGCHIQTQSLYGLASTLGKAEVDLDKTKFLYNSIASSQKADGSLRISHPEFAKTQTTLGIWSLTSWPSGDQSFRPLYRSAKYLYDRRIASGGNFYWAPDHASGWWNTNVSHTALSMVGFADVLRKAKTVDLAQVRDYALINPVSLGAGTNPLDIEMGPDGAYYVAKHSSGTIVRLDPLTGGVTTVVSGLPVNSAYGLGFAADGTLYVSGNGYLRRVNASGTTDLVLSNSGYLTDVETGPDGLLYIADYSNHRILRLLPGGQSEVFAAGGLLLNPYGLAFDSAGNLLVANYGRYNILKIAPDKAVSVMADGLASRPVWLDVAPDGNVYSSSTAEEGLTRVGPDGVAERMMDVSVPRGVRVVGDKVLVVNQTANTVSELQRNLLVTSWLPLYGDALAGGTRYLLSNYRDGSTDNTVQAVRLWGLAEARTVITDPALLSQIDTAIAYADNLLRTRQRADGGWGRYVNQASDALITAMVGIALDYSHPSPDDPQIRKTIQYLLNTQATDGSWTNVNNGLGTRLASTSFVMAYLPKALERLGGIDVDLHLDLPANIQLSNPSLAPATTLPGVDGGKEYVWKLLGVTGSGRAVEFDLTLADMQLHETRAAARAAYMEFANSFTSEKLRVDVNVPAVKTANDMALAVATDKPVYGANEPVAIQSTVTNVAQVVTSGQVLVAIRAPGSTVNLAELPAVAVENLAPGAQTVLSAAWNTAATFAGNYEVYGRLLDSQGRLVAEAVSPFAVVAPAQLAASSVTTDKPVYQAWDAVQIDGRVRNASNNALLAPSRVEITVRRPDGSVLYFDTRTLNELVPGGLVDVPFNLMLSDADAGVYPVELVLKDEFSRVQLSASGTSFQVQRNVLQGVLGQVTVSAPTTYQGDPNSCAEVAKNVSATTLAGVRLIHQLVNMDAGTVIDEYSEIVDLAAGSVVHSYFRNINTSGFALGGYSCVVKAEYGGLVRTLAFGGFRVVEPPIKIDSKLQIGTRGRLLVLLDAPKRCKQNEDHEHDRDDDHDRVGKSSSGSDEHKDGHKADCDRDPHGPKDTDGLNAQRAYLETLLTKAGWSYTITDTAEDFTRELRSGGYRLYALFSEHAKLDEDVQKELREAVYGGEGLLVAGGHDERHHGLDEALGLRYRGKVSQTAGLTLTDGPLGLTGNVALAYDHVLHVSPTTAVVAGFYDIDPTRYAKYCESDDDGDGHHDHDGRMDKHSDGNHRDDGHGTAKCAPKAAVTFNGYGQGHAVFAGFDLLAEAVRLGDDSLLAMLVGHGLTAVNPLSPSLVQGGVVPVTLKLENLGVATAVHATITLPAGLTLVDAGAATPSGSSPETLTWDLSLAVSEARSLTFYMRLPASTEAQTITALIEAPVAGTFKTFGNPTLVLTPEPVADGVVGRAMLEALIAAGTADEKRLRQVLHHLQHAERYLADDLDKALKELLKATDALAETNLTETGPIRVEIDGWIRAIEMQIDPEKHRKDH